MKALSSLNYPSKVCLSELVNSLKGNNSRQSSRPGRLGKSRGVLWTASYFTGSGGGAPLAVLKQYIEQQGRP